MREEIQAKLDEQYLIDLKKLMDTDYGRRVFSYLLQHCGFKSAELKGNSKDFHNAGRRSVAIDLIFACDALGLPGVALRQSAEMEYIKLQIAIGEEIKKKNSTKIERK